MYNFCLCCILLFMFLGIWYYQRTSNPMTTQDPRMYAAILVKSESCGFCAKQLEILKEEGGKEAMQRIKILDSEDDKEYIQKVIGSYSSVPLWYNPITNYKSPGLKSIDELKDMGILLE